MPASSARAWRSTGSSTRGSRSIRPSSKSAPAFHTLKRSVLDGQSAADVERAARGLLKTYEGLARAQEFDGLNLPSPDEVREAAAGLQQLFEVRQRLAEDKGAGRRGMITLDRRFQIVRYPRLPRDTVQAVDPQVCLWGYGLGISGATDRDPGRRAHRPGRPAVNPDASPLADAPRPAACTAATGALVQNPEGNKAKVSYVIDGVSYELKPGESRTHAITAKSQIQLQPGRHAGQHPVPALRGHLPVRDPGARLAGDTRRPSRS